MHILKRIFSVARLSDGLASGGLAVLLILFAVTPTFASGTSGSLGDYSIESVQFQQYMMVSLGSATAGNGIVDYFGDGSHPLQQFDIVSSGSNTYEIRDHSAGLCVTVGSSYAALENCTGAASQLYTLTQQSDGSYQIGNGTNCLQVPSTFSLITSGSCSAAGTSWTFAPIANTGTSALNLSSAGSTSDSTITAPTTPATPTSPSVPVNPTTPSAPSTQSLSGQYYFESSAFQQFMMVSLGAASPGNGIILYFGDGSNPLQQFDLVSTGTNTYEIKDHSADLCLTAGSSFVALQNCTGASTQLFTVNKQSDGSYQIGYGTNCLGAPSSFSLLTSNSCNAAGSDWILGGSSITTNPPTTPVTPPTTLTPPVVTPPVTTPPSTAPTPAPYTNGTRVITTAYIHVRVGPEKQQTLITTVPTGSTGTVIGGPTLADNYQWWNVQYDNGTTGWSFQNYFTTTTIPAPTPPTPPTTPPVVTGMGSLPQDFRLMTLGDSMTAGYGSPDTGGYRGPLYQSLVAEGYSPQMVGSINCGGTTLPTGQQQCDGVGGDTLAGIDSRVNQGIITQENPDVVLLLAGFNTVAYSGQTIPADLAQLQQLIKDIHAQKPGVHIVVASLIASTQCCSLPTIQTYDAGVPGIVSAFASQGYDISYVDMYPVVPANDLYDYVHPNPTGYQLVAAAWLQAINAIASAPNQTVTPPSTPPNSGLPSWMSAPATSPAEDESRIVTINQISQSGQVTPTGVVTNIAANFTATQPLTTSDTITIALVNSSDQIVAQTSNNLNNGLTIIPTTSWKGPVSITSTLTVPGGISDGSYYVMMSLVNPSDSVIKLNPGTGVYVDNTYRYDVGTLTIKAGSPQPTPLAPQTLNLTGYKLTFDDEFNKMSVSDSTVNDGSNWYTRNEQCCMLSSDGSGTAMVGLSDPHNPYSLIPGGGLNIRLQKTGNTWTSGVLTSVDNSGKGFSQQYGYFEMRAKFSSGNDTWPAFWLLNTAAKSSNAPAGEADVVEYIANPGFPNYIASTLHDWSNGTTPAMSHNYVTVPSDGYHTYGMMWDPNTVTMYYDGTVISQVPTPSIMHQPYYMLIDNGLGAGWPTNQTPSIDDMQIQYIRAYSK